MRRSARSLDPRASTQSPPSVFFGSTPEYGRNGQSTGPTTPAATPHLRLRTPASRHERENGHRHTNSGMCEHTRCFSDGSRRADPPEMWIPAHSRSGYQQYPEAPSVLRPKPKFRHRARAARHRSDKRHAHGRIAKRQIRRSAAAQRRTQPSPSLPGRRPSGEVHRRGAARQVSSDTSLEVRCLSAEAAAVIVTCRIASPTPSALRVSHSLSGFTPPTPRGSISRHIHP